MLCKMKKNNMIAFLDNLIYMPMNFIGFLIQDVIILLTKPMGFGLVFASLTFFQYSTVKSIIKDFKKWKKSKKVEEKEKCPECNIPVLPTASLV